MKSQLTVEFHKLRETIAHSTDIEVPTFFTPSRTYLIGQGFTDLCFFVVFSFYIACVTDFTVLQCIKSVTSKIKLSQV